MIHIVLRLLYDFLSLKNYVNVPSKTNKQKTSKFFVFVFVLKVTDENMQDPDPLVRGMDPADSDRDQYQNFIDPQH